MRFSLRFGGGLRVEVELDEEVGRRLLDHVPFTSVANRWGDEVYFELPLDLGLRGERVEMEVGEVAYWPEGNSLCIFFGPTPVSRGGEPRAYSPVRPVGRVVGDPLALKRVRDGEAVEVSLGT